MLAIFRSVKVPEKKMPTAWTDTRLSHPQKKPEHQNTGIVLSSDMCDDNDAPYEKHAAHILCNGQFLDQEVGRYGPEEIPEVEDCSHP